MIGGVDHPHEARCVGFGHGHLLVKIKAGILAEYAGHMEVDIHASKPPYKFSQLVGSVTSGYIDNLILYLSGKHLLQSPQRALIACSHAHMPSG